MPSGDTDPTNTLARLRGASAQVSRAVVRYPVRFTLDTCVRPLR